MTHDELLKKIEWLEGAYVNRKNCQPCIKYLNTLRAVVELHKPERGVIESWFKWLNGTKIIGCRLCEELYPCPTIQAIEKELS
jgi:hypothetical protein